MRPQIKTANWLQKSSHVPLISVDFGHKIFVCRDRDDGLVLEALVAATPEEPLSMLFQSGGVVLSFGNVRLIE